MLSKLVLDNNQISTLPDSVFSHQNLRFLMCSCNVLESLPHIPLSCGALEELVLSSNALTSIVGLSTVISLKQLILDKNRITSVPEGFGKETILKFHCIGLCCSA